MTGWVVTAKVADVAPAGTATLAGTDATPGVALESATTIPPAGAAELSDTVPVEPDPPTTFPGFRVTAVRVKAAGLTVS